MTWTCNCAKGHNTRLDWQKKCPDCKKEKPALTKQPKEQPAKQPPISTVQRKKQQQKQRIPVKRGKSHQKKSKDIQKKKAEKQVQKQPQQLSLKGIRSKPSMAKDEPKVEQPKTKETTGKQQNTQILWTFSNVVLFTGSASYVDETDKKLFKGVVAKNQYMTKNYILSEWDHQNFMALIKDKIPKSIQSKAYKFKFILNTEKKPFKEGDRKFKLYDSMKAYPTTSTDCGEFNCASSYYKYSDNEKPYKLRNGEEVTNTSSYMLREDLRSWVEGIVESKKVGFPVFSISDCNTFHTSGYVWSYYALKKAPRSLHPLKLAVINFDQHWDDGGSGDIIGSDHWGNGVLKELDELGFKGMYIVAGFGKEGKVGYVSEYDKNISTDKSVPYVKFNWENFWKEKGKDINAVFVTVDRDCLKDHYTQWQDDSYFKDWKKLKSAMSDALTPLFHEKREPTVHLIGIDITGLPEHYEIWQGRYTKRVKPNSSSVWADVDSQIADIRAEFAEQLKATASL